VVNNKQCGEAILLFKLFGFHILMVQSFEHLSSMSKDTASVKFSGKSDQ